MGRLLLVASFAMLGATAMASAKPDHANQGSGKSRAANSSPVGYGAGGCPPGLKGKNVSCMPPGRYKKLFEIGQRVPSSFKGLMPYSALPYDLRMGYGGALDRSARYVYDQQFLYRVDPETMIVRQILRALP
ncbi:hypothetical protein [Sphingomonas daechungensis]|uniref:hypothetical protein n=1 Tax=Sphingomonas daechungensis TaxID=1176646 RepID=UPI003782E527